MGRPRKQPQDKVKKEGFSAPQYLVAAAKRAAKLDEGNDFSRWIVAAIREKLEHDEPGLMAKMRAEMRHAGDYIQPAPSLATAAKPAAREIVINKLAATPFANLPLAEMQKELARMEAELGVAVAKAKTTAKEKPKA